MRGITAADNEISVTTEGVTVKGDIAGDLRPPIQRVVRIADSVARLLENVVTAPLDFMSNNVERLRRRYIDRLAEIPMDRRQDPPLRIAYAVVRHAAESADEPDLQEMFANLLASASDSDRSLRAHPAFAAVIGELRAADAKVLIDVDERAGYRGVDLEHFRCEGLTDRAVQEAVSNLVRLGLIDWQARTYTEDEIRRLTGNNTIRLTSHDLAGLVRDIEKDVHKLKVDVIRQVQQQQRRRVLVMTEFGSNFVATVTRNDAITRSKPVPDAAGEAGG